MKQKILNETEHFRSSDLALITALSLSFPIVAIDKEPTGKSFFIFKRGAGFDEMLKRYWAREMVIEPQAFFNQLKIIKTRIYSEE